jgi:hypothetical protein
MGKASIICIVLVFALLLEDGSSMRKKTEKEEEEDKKIAEAVNRTLVEEEKKRKEDEIEAKKKKEEEDKKKKNGTLSDEKTSVEQGGQGEVCPSCNCTCPIVEPCPKIGQCPPCEVCPEETPCQAPEECPPVKECPKIKEHHCPEEKPCLPCGPCPTVNHTSPSVPDACPESASMSVPVALMVGAAASLLVTGVAAALGLLLRYTSPLFSGLLFVVTVVLTWYLSSHYPDAAREIGGQVVTVLQEASQALSHRVRAALQRQRDQVGFPI